MFLGVVTSTTMLFAKYWTLLNFKNGAGVLHFCQKERWCRKWESDPQPLDWKSDIASNELHASRHSCPDLHQNYRIAEKIPQTVQQS